MHGKPGRPKGQPKTGGKPKGYSAKHVLFSKSLKERIEIAGIDIVAEYLSLLGDAELPVQIRLRILDTLLQYTEPTIKPVEKPASEGESASQPVTSGNVAQLLALASNTSAS